MIGNRGVLSSMSTRDSSVARPIKLPGLGARSLDQIAREMGAILKSRQDGLYGGASRSALDPRVQPRCVKLNRLLPLAGFPHTVERIGAVPIGHGRRTARCIDGFLCDLSAYSTRKPRPTLALLALTAAALGPLTSGCGASNRIAPKGRPPIVTAATAHRGGLTIALAVTPVSAPAGSAIRFTASAEEDHAAGAIGYRLSYGDGAAAESGAMPLFCVGGPAPTMNRTWRFSHRYKSTGNYRAVLSVDVNCTVDRATAAVTVAATGR